MNNKYFNLFPFFLIITIALFSCNGDINEQVLIQRIENNLNDTVLSHAEEDIEVLLSKSQSNSYVFTLKGRLEVLKENHKEAILSFNQAIKLNNSDIRPLLEKAKLKLILGDYQGSLIDCDSAELINKNILELYLTRALIYEELTDVPNAIIAYESAIEFTDVPIKTYYSLALLKLDLGKQDEACELLRKAGELGFMDAFELIKESCNGSIKENQKLKIEKNEVNSNMKIIDLKELRVSIPNNWKQVKPQQKYADGSTLLLDYGNSTLSNSVVLFNVNKSAWLDTKGISVYDYESNLFDVIRNSVPTAKKINQKRELIDGKKSIALNYSVIDKGRKLIIYNNSVLHKNHSYTLTFTCLSGNEKEYQSKIKMIKKSFSFK
jgi:tetratricopeptide (TPR) repeat protein